MPSYEEMFMSGREQSDYSKKLDEYNKNPSYCDGNHDKPVKLKMGENDFCEEMKDKFSGKKYCMQCQLTIAMANGGIKI